MNDINIIFNQRYKEMIKKLTNEEAGVLFKIILNYINNEEQEEFTENSFIAFQPIKYDLDNLLNKKEKIREKNKKNGKLGGRPSKKEKETEKTITIGKYEKGNYYLTNQYENITKELKEKIYKSKEGEENEKKTNNK